MYSSSISDSDDEQQEARNETANNHSNKAFRKVNKYNSSSARQRSVSEDEEEEVAPVEDDEPNHDESSSVERASTPEFFPDDDEPPAVERETSTSNRKRPLHEDEGGDQSPLKKPAGGIGERLMAKMGFKPGEGLGRDKQGIAEPIKLAMQKGRMGLGHQESKALQYDPTKQWDDSEEKKTVEETPVWMSLFSDDANGLVERQDEVNRVIKDKKQFLVAEKKLFIEDEVDVVDGQLLKKLLEAKTVFDSLNDRDLRNSRTRANPYETIGSGIFQNRAAMKSANMDGIFNFLFSKEDTNLLEEKCPLDVNKPGKNDKHRHQELFYFADVCAGPGGFSEYQLWRKNFYNAKGSDDFKLSKFLASSPLFFEPYYGTHDDGDVTKPANIDSFEDLVKRGTEGIGVDLMMADGGFCVDGQENIQEILSKRIYLCQLLVSLCIVREGGNFYCKLFDVFTRFSYELIFLMSLCYQDVCIHKPHTSRPANSERYIICKGLMKRFSDPIRDFLKAVNRKQQELVEKKSDKDVQQLLPHHFGNELTESERLFLIYITDNNNMIAKRQAHYLEKYRVFATNVGLVDMDQADLREKCMKYWRVPYDMQPHDSRRTGLNRVQQVHSPEQLMSKFAPKMFGSNDFSAKSFEFEKHWEEIFIKNAKPGQYVHEEYRCFWATEFKTNQSAPVKMKVLVATPDAVYYLDESSHWTTCDRFLYRVPGPSILLVELTEEMAKSNGKLSLPGKNNGSIIRIFDAAVLAGDDVSKLSYDDRMKCIVKYCKAATLVENVVHVAMPVQKPYNSRGRGRGQPQFTFERKSYTPLRLVPAKVFTLDRLNEHLPRELVLNNENIGVIEEDGKSYMVSGLFVIKFLQDRWSMQISRKMRQCYAFNMDTRISVFSDRFEHSGCLTTFWDTLVTAKRPHYRMFWNWRAKYGDTPYGPRWILNDEQNAAGPTLHEINKRMNELKQ
ncbi:unnamed protein product, partial [Mesorhabditis belari]|uniref:Cap-specific mRNA (nucleoside-2'-O-)-methyltransferase 1 n=1 Tax=Mesorhabditis belari TaxID=2138241 RepID=A0AAF3ES20_9BILA